MSNVFSDVAIGIISWKIIILSVALVLDIKFGKALPSTLTVDSDI